MPALSKKQEIIWSLHVEGKDNDHICNTLAMSKQGVANTLYKIRKKLGVRGRGCGTEVRNPDLAAAAFEVAADPMTVSQSAAIRKMNDDLREAGIPGKVSVAIVRRMMVRYGNAVSVKKAFNTKELINSIDENLYLINSYMDDKVMAEASLRDLGLVKASLIEKRNLLKGEPTAILSAQERSELVVLMPQLLQECKVRGITVEGEASVVEPTS